MDTLGHFAGDGLVRRIVVQFDVLDVGLVYFQEGRGVRLQSLPCVGLRSNLEALRNRGVLLCERTDLWVRGIRWPDVLIRLNLR